jgi:cell wall-associated NlpC family hydrolase
LTAQQQALSQVKGQLAVEVAKVQVQQQAAEQAQEKAVLAAQSDLPPSNSPATAARAPSTAPPATAATTVTAPTRTTAKASPPSTTGSPGSPAGAGSSPAGGSSSGSQAQAPGVDKVLAYARAQLGKPYQWAGAGPSSFDCSGLVMMAWDQAGIYFPHLAQDQYNLTARVPLSAVLPGDLVFFGTPDDVYHVGIYVGNGDMIDAPETGQNVQVQPIYWDSLLGAGRVTASS